MNTKRLALVTDEHLHVFKTAIPEIERIVIDEFMKLTDLTAELGDDPRLLLKQGYRFTVEMLASIMIVGEEILLGDQVQWTITRLPHDGVSPQHVRQLLVICRQVFSQRLPAETAELILPYFDWMLNKHQELINRD